MACLSYIFLLDTFIFTITNDNKEENNQKFSYIGEGFYLNVRR